MAMPAKNLASATKNWGGKTYRRRGLTEHWDKWAVDKDLQMIVIAMQGDRLIKEHRVFALGIPANWLSRE